MPVTGNHRKTRCEAPVCHRYPGIGRNSRGRRNTRHKFKRDTSGGEGLGLFSAAGKEAWVAALEPYDRLSLLASIDQ
jgi:hypothetical protein